MKENEKVEVQYRYRRVRYSGKSGSGIESEKATQTARFQMLRDAMEKIVVPMEK